MADSPSPKPPAPRLDRGALERVLARAAELQIGGDAPEEFTEQQLLDLGKEVGLSPQNLRQALAEERTRSSLTESDTGLSSSILGPNAVHASRTVPGRPSDLLAAIDTWMQRQELLRVKRHLADRIVWEPRKDFVVNIKRAFGGGDYALTRAFEVSATAIAVDDSRSHVGLEADFRSQRTRGTVTVGASTIVAGGVTAALLTIGIPAVLAAAPVAIVAPSSFFGARAYHRHVATRAHLTLEQLLDRLERGDVARRGADGLLDMIFTAAGSLPRR